MGLENLNERRTLIEDVFKGKKDKVEIAGWVNNTRELGKIRFLVLRDVSAIIQITAVKDKVDKKIFDEIGKVPRESVVYVRGQIKVSKQDYLMFLYP